MKPNFEKEKENPVKCLYEGLQAHRNRLRGPHATWATRLSWEGQWGMGRGPAAVGSAQQLLRGGFSAESWRRSGPWAGGRGLRGTQEELTGPAQTDWHVLQSFQVSLIERTGFPKHPRLSLLVIKTYATVLRSVWITLYIYFYHISLHFYLYVCFIIYMFILVVPAQKNLFINRTE